MRKQSFISRNGVLFTLLVVATAFTARSQQVAYPETVWVPVIFYDFHAVIAGAANKLNPDFEVDPGAGAVVKGMIQNYLSADRKPIFRANLMSNLHVNQWFRPSGSNGTGATFAQDPASGDWSWSNLKSSGKPNEWVGQNFSNADSMADIVIYDSLPFRLIDNGTGLYQYLDSNFFPLNGRGFGAEPPAYVPYNWTNTNNLNYSFTMEIHTSFLMRKDLTFSFAGDDDTWVFLADSLRVDLGGIHTWAPGAVNLNTLNLVNNQRYNFDFFYAERHVTGSHIQINTNILVPYTLGLQTLATKVVAGVPAQVLKAVIYDNTNAAIDSLGKYVTWAIDPATKKLGDTLLVSQGASVTFLGTQAHRYVTITAKYVDAKTHQTLTNTQSLYVNPGPASSLDIETLANDSVGVDSVQAHPDTAGVTLWFSSPPKNQDAVLRDQYGNFVSFATQAIWASGDANKASVAAQTGKNWIGTISKGAGAGGLILDSTYVIASSGAMRDSVKVVVHFVLLCATPVATPGAGTYYGSQIVTLSSATFGDTIWYCIDCTADPSRNGAGCTSYIPGSGTPITIRSPNPSTLKAIAVRNDSGYLPSAVLTAVYTNLDWQGPTISGVTYYLGGSRPGAANPLAYDTLLVQFSEPVACSTLTTPSGVFNSIPIPPGALFPAGFCSGGDTVMQVLVLLPAGTKVVPGKDSLGLVPGSISDRYGNLTTGGTSPIQWGRMYPYTTQTWPNPFQPGVSQIPDSLFAILHAYSQANPGLVPAPLRSSMVMNIKSIKRVDVAHSSALIYDALGNIVITNLHVYGNPTDDYAFYVLWDGLNRNGRLVGSGTYLAVFTIKELGDNKVNTIKQKIGVRR